MKVLFGCEESATCRHEMTDEQHFELSQQLHAVAGMVILSGYDCPLYQDLYAGWRRVSTGAHADGARDRVESLWLSPNVHTNQAMF